MGLESVSDDDGLATTISICREILGGTQYGDLSVGSAAPVGTTGTTRTGSATLETDRAHRAASRWLRVAHKPGPVKPGGQRGGGDQGGDTGYERHGSW